jgi:hypothetical protein
MVDLYFWLSLPYALGTNDMNSHILGTKEQLTALERKI